MNSESKAFASLSSGLLARKGAARPAMKPHGFGQMGGGLDDLGWNDMGFEPPKPAETPVRDEDHDGFGEAVPEPALRNPVAALTPAQSPVHDQQAELEERFAGYDQDAGEDEEIDETAELYDPSEELRPLGKSAKSDPLGLGPISSDTVATAEPVAESQPEPELQAQSELEPEPAIAEVVRLPQPPAASHRTVARSRVAPGAKGKAAFTLRLDSERHLKLRLACAVTGRSAQQLVTAALDQLMETMPELGELAGHVPAAARANRKG